MIKINFINLISILFIPIPLLLITGPFLPDLSISLISIIFLFYCFKNGKFYLFKNKFFVIFLFFWFYLILNSIFNNFNLTSLKIALTYIRYGIFVVAMVYVIEKNNEITKHFFYVLFFCFTILILDGFFQFFFGSNFFGYPILEENRISSFFRDELILGSYLSRFMPLMFGLIILLKYNKVMYLPYILIFVLSEVLVFLSGERVAFFFINISALYIIFLIEKFKILRLITLISSLLIIIIISINSPDVKKRIIDQTLEQFSYEKKKTELVRNDNNQSNDEILQDKFFGIYLFSIQHTHHYLSAYKMFIDNPFFGVGIKNFRNFCYLEKYSISELSCSTHPHNYYLQILSEIGFFGFIPIIIILIIFIFYSLKHFIGTFKKKYLFNAFEICMLSNILIFIWPLIPTGNFFSNWLNIIHLLPIIFFIWSYKKKLRN